MEKCTHCDGFGNILDYWDKRVRDLPMGNIWALRELEQEMIDAGVDPVKYLHHAAKNWVDPGFK